MNKGAKKGAAIKGPDTFISPKEVPVRMLVNRELYQFNRSLRVRYYQ